MKNLKKLKRSDLKEINGGGGCRMMICPQCNNNDGPTIACVPIGMSAQEVCCPFG